MLATNLQKFAFLCLPSALIKGVHHYTQLSFFFFFLALTVLEIPVDQAVLKLRDTSAS